MIGVSVCSDALAKNAHLAFFLRHQHLSVQPSGMLAREPDDDTPETVEQTPWRRILWARQPYADNYVPPDFLGELRTKPTSALPSLTKLMLWSLPLSQHVCITLTFVALFLQLRDGLVPSETLAACSAVAIVVCGATMPTTNVLGSDEFALHDVATVAPPLRSKHTRALAQPLSYAVLGLVILALSPLLKTLTEATTSDSIAALSTTLFLLSFALADFSSSDDDNGDDGGGDGAFATTGSDDALHNLAPSGLQHGTSSSGRHRRGSSVSVKQSSQRALATPPLPATLSLNAALCASIVLASRLQSPIDVFSLVLAAIGLFAFLPRWLRHHVGRCATRQWHVAVSVTTGMLAISVALLMRCSPTAAWANVVAAIFLSVVCPAWMRKAQGWKQARRGPWDMGVPRLRSR